ncbi:MAG: hypothetical protein ACM3ML_20145 [Micromonosporaceae bacterium]
MVVPILVAIIGAIAGVTGAIISSLYARRLARIQASLEEQRDISKARRDYEYEARKRLYSVYEPIKFQLVDIIGQALRRISILSLGPPPAGSVEEAASIYELLAPTALVRMLDRNLTLADMNLEPNVSVEYGFMKAAYRVLADSQSIASIYSAVSDRNCTTVADEGLLPYQLDDAADALLGIAPEDSNATNVAKRPVALKTFAQFIGVFRDACTTQDESGLNAIAKLIGGFTPANRPIFWRCLVTQVLLYGCYLDLVLRSSPIQSDRLRELARSLLPEIEQALGAGLRLDKFWKSEEKPRQPEVDANAVRDALVCAERYYQVRVLPAVNLAIVALQPQPQPQPQ